MQIFEPNPGQLALRTRPNWLIMLLGTLLVLVGFMAAAVPGKATTLTLTRDAHGLGAGEIHVITMFREFRVVRIPLRLLSGAAVDPVKFVGVPSCYHLDLDVSDGLGAMYFSWYANKERVEREVARIDHFVADPTQHSLVITNDKRPFYYPVGALIAFVGLTLLLWASLGVNVTVDQPSARVFVARKGLLGSYTDVVPFGDIKGFEVAGIAGDCQLYIQLASGRRVTLSSSTDMQNMVGPRRIRAIRLEEAQRLRAFCEPGSGPADGPPATLA